MSGENFKVVHPDAGRNGREGIDLAGEMGDNVLPDLDAKIPGQGVPHFVRTKQRDRGDGKTRKVGRK